MNKWLYGRHNSSWTSVFRLIFMTRWADGSVVTSTLGPSQTTSYSTQNATGCTLVTNLISVWQNKHSTTINTLETLQQINHHFFYHTLQSRCFIKSSTTRLLCNTQAHIFSLVHMCQRSWSFWIYGWTLRRWHYR